MDKQHEAVQLKVHASDFTVFQWMADETKFQMMMKAIAQAKTNAVEEVSLLAVHGRVLWGSFEGHVEEEELVCRPAALEANTAAAMWASFKAILPPCLWNVLQGLPPVGLVSLLPGSDMFSANQMMLKHVENLTAAAADKVFVLKGWCHQHKTGNALGPVVQQTGIIRPEFCLARRMRAEKFKARFRQGRRVALKLCLKHIKGSTHPDWQPSEADLRHARGVLELFYYKKDLRNSDDPGDAEGTRTAESLRRTRGEALLRRFAGNWKERDIVFWDPHDEVASRDDAIDEAERLLEEAGFHVAGNPAENKWLSVWPVNQSVGMMQSFHFLFLFALRYSRTDKPTPVGTPPWYGFKDLSPAHYEPPLDPA